MSTVNIPRSSSTLRVGLGTFRVELDPGVTLASLPLGACLGVVMYDKLHRIGGLLHSLLPNSSVDPEKSRMYPSLFLDTGFQAMLQELEARGACKEDILVYVAGGCGILDDSGMFDIGKKGCESLAEALAGAGLSIEAQAVGGLTSHSIKIHLGTGEVSVEYSGSSKSVSLCKQLKTT